MQLSGGMQQRSAIARAGQGPAHAAMDERFGALDRQTREPMEELLLGTREEQRNTVLFVTHDSDEVVFAGSRVIPMSARRAFDLAQVRTALRALGCSANAFRGVGPRVIQGSP